MGYKEAFKLVRTAQGLASKRNHSVLAHGHKNLRAGDVGLLRRFEDSLAKGVLGDDAERVAGLAQQLSPPGLRKLFMR